MKKKVTISYLTLYKDSWCTISCECGKSIRTGYLPLPYKDIYCSQCGGELEQITDKEQLKHYELARKRLEKGYGHIHIEIIKENWPSDIINWFGYDYYAYKETKEDYFISKPPNVYQIPKAHCKLL